ncbi:Type VI secretion system VasI, EvfG, VC_A0118 [Sphingobium sp. AP50]|uniref:type VI secretion system-associated protein TagO n=1 Tax=Sphingobium sp. AP50 TaxID=1884369 RepID=UPI0008C3B27D|nr:type VI secretion system-associated protein TagO [Sphingobium sp. AP50]SEK07068.1 Type VI secretion system VasI, EvfG, VC_A0118 [Sphingobium sp. AP50]
MIRYTSLAILLGFLASQPAHAEWKLRQEYTDGDMTLVSVSSDSQTMPVGLRDSYSASLSISCIPKANNLWLQLVWPEQMTAMKTITIIRNADGFPAMPQEWNASGDGGEMQSFTLDGQTISGTELMNRLLTGKGQSLALKPQGNGRIQDAIFSLDGLESKLREVTKACPKWSYFDNMKAAKGQ